MTADVSARPDALLVSRALSGFAAALGVVVLIGWAFHVNTYIEWAVIVCGFHAALAVFIWRAATGASRLDRRCRQALNDLAAANQLLEASVERRTDSLAATTTELQTLFQSAPVGLVKLDREGSCVSVNPRWCELSGLSEEQSSGGGWWQAFHPDDRDAAIAECSTIITDGQAVTLTSRLLTPGGQTTWVHGSCALLCDGSGVTTGYLGVTVDITAYMESQAELTAAQARNATAFASSPIGMALVSLDGHFIEVNSALCQLVGRSAADVVGVAKQSLWRPDEDDLEADRLKPLLDGDISSYEIDHGIVRPDGTACWVTETVAVVMIEDSPAYLVSEYVDVTERRLAEQRLAHQALHDSLTGLPNRVLFMDRLEHALDRARRNGSAIAVLYIDLDHFKVINDGMGHAGGDQVLRAVGARLSATARRIDTVGRLGGDEFVVLAEDAAGDDKAAELAIRLSGALEQPMQIGDGVVTVKASIGIALTFGGMESAAVMLRNADTAMYRAKDRGRARYELFDEELRVQAAHRRSIVSGLRRAVEGDGPDTIMGVYQPVIDLATGRVEGAEALARWFNGTEIVQPADFIPIAEESGLILPIGEAILLEACTKAAAWRQAGLDLDISVNVSARQVVRHDFFEVVERSLAVAGLEHEHLVLELTESVLLDVIGSASARIQQLRDLGVRFSIDDFGTGFSSLAYLHDLTVDQLKIDRRFTAGLGINPQDEAIVASIITLSKELGLDLIAEGVETDAQADHLRRLGCERAQGFLFSRPVSDQELARQAAPMAHTLSESR